MAGIVDEDLIWLSVRLYLGDDLRGTDKQDGRSTRGTRA